MTKALLKPKNTCYIRAACARKANLLETSFRVSHKPFFLHHKAKGHCLLKTSLMCDINFPPNSQ